MDLASLLLAGRDIKHAHERIDIILQKQPNNAGAHMLLANVYSEEHKHDEAYGELLKAIEIDPNRAEFYMNLAVFQMQDKEVNAAEKNFEKSIRMQPSSVLAVPV